MLYGHFAVSGDQEDSQICCLCRFVAEADDLEKFDHAWKAVLLKYSTGFEGAACFCDVGIFQSWDISRRRSLLMKLSEVVTRCALVPLRAFAVREHFSRCLLLIALFWQPRVLKAFLI